MTTIESNTPSGENPELRGGDVIELTQSWFDSPDGFKNPIFEKPGFVERITVDKNGNQIARVVFDKGFYLDVSPEFLKKSEVSQEVPETGWEVLSQDNLDVIKNALGYTTLSITEKGPEIELEVAGPDIPSVKGFLPKSLPLKKMLDDIATQGGYVAKDPGNTRVHREFKKGLESLMSWIN